MSKFNFRALAVAALALPPWAQTGASVTVRLVDRQHVRVDLLTAPEPGTRARTGPTPT